MDRLTVETFEEFSSSDYGETTTYFVHTDHYVLISIPVWNWSFMWNFEAYSDEELKAACTKALTGPMFFEGAKEITERFYQYLLRGK
ncbi:hypothetical protein GGGNBK_23170 (plasmid) [Sporosarcina sp. ANT_H38]